MKKEVFAWSLYDLANTAFTSPFQTIFWPLIVTSFLGGNELQIGLTVSISLLFVSILAPLFGAISDMTNRRMPFIMWTSFAAIALIAILPRFSLMWDLVIAGMISVLYNIGLTVYNSLLPKIASQKEMGKVSGIGIASGFLGTILSLGATYLALNYFSQGKDIETAVGINAAFPVMALFFLLFSLPLFLTIKDENVKKLKIGITKIFSGIFSSLKNASRLKGMIPFGISTFLFANALAAINVFFFLFAKKEFGIDLLGFMLIFSFQSIGATSGAYLFGRLADRIGPKKVLTIAGFMWIIVIIIFLASKTKTAFWIASLLGSIAYGGVFSTSRAFLVFLAPSKKLGEFFGYSQILGKFTGLFGPVIAGWLIISHGYDYALLFVLATLVLAFIALHKIPDIRKIINA